MPLCKLYIIPNTTYRLHLYYSTCRHKIKGIAGDFYEKNELSTDSLVRVALYIWVSGEEQKIKGLSLEAYAKERDWIIVGVYIDAAKTARKNMHKRAEFQHMIEAVKRNEIDVLLFCRLDRWFRC